MFVLIFSLYGRTQQFDLLIVIFFQDWFGKFEFLQFEVLHSTAQWPGLFPKMVNAAISCFAFLHILTFFLMALWLSGTVSVCLSLLGANCLLRFWILNTLFFYATCVYEL